MISLGPTPNADLIEGALTSICDLTSDQSCESEVFGHVFMEQLPKTARQYMLTKFPDRSREWGYERKTTFGLSTDVSVIDHELFSAAKEVLSSGKARTLHSISGDQVLVIIDPEDHNIVLESPEADAKIKTKINDLALLAPSPEVRVATFRTMLDRFGPTAPDFHEFLSALASRKPTHQELSKVFHESVNGVIAVQRALQRKIDFGQPISLSDVLPHSIDFLKKFAGPLPETRDPESYIRNMLVPYRCTLLARDLDRGLDICCLGALRDDLCPGQWMLDFDDDAVWEALSKCSTHRAPFSLLAALDVALYRQRDGRFREFAEQSLIKLWR